MDKRYDHQGAEAAARSKWDSEKTYQPDPSRPLYTIDTPPPTVSGSLHIGHVFSYTQTDILARFERLNGKNVFYPFGFDDNGLATERFVEKKLKLRAHTMPRSEFIAKCLAETAQAASEFKQLWQSMGLSADLEHTYSTISKQTRKISQQSFIDLYQKGFAYRKNEPALYCANCRTSVAQAELDDQQQPSQFNDLIFKTSSGEKLTIGTTRPELLSSCVALLFHPNDQRYQHLQNQQAIVPIFNWTVPIVADGAVNPDKGTGLVMCCTFGDKQDIEWYKKFNFPYKQSIGLNGKWLPHTGSIAGLNFKQARELILELLKQDGLLVAQRPIVHNVNVHERCQKEIEYLAIPQWYIKILEYKQDLIAQVEKIQWRPAFMKARCLDWIENLGWDWGISRQRFYGIPFPIWHCQDCQTVLLAEPEQLPIDPQETTYGKPCPNCQSTAIVPETDVMDTWNTSSITPLICFDLWHRGQVSPFDSSKISQFLPMNMRPQAHDIIRTWAFYTIVKSWMHFKQIPWQTIVISGHVLSSAQEKLSKSKGNSNTSPHNLLERFPADAIRYWTASANLGYDAAFSEEQIKIGCKLITKLWNAFSFIKLQLEAHQLPETQPLQLGLVNEWILTRASSCFESYQKYLARSEFGHALTQLEQFFWSDFCDNYLELIKNMLFNPDQYAKSEVAATIWTLHNVGLRILQLYAPYVPYVTETIYGIIYSAKGSLHTTHYGDVQISVQYEASATLMAHIINLIGQVRKLKSENQLSLKTPLQQLVVNCDQALFQQLIAHEQLIKGITQAIEIKYQPNQHESQLTQVNEQYFCSVQI